MSETKKVSIDVDISLGWFFLVLLIFIMRRCEYSERMSLGEPAQPVAEEQK